jgi:hypothetical protein
MLMGLGLVHFYDVETFYKQTGMVAHRNEVAAWHKRTGIYQYLAAALRYRLLR